MGVSGRRDERKEERCGFRADWTDVTGSSIQIGRKYNAITMNLIDENEK